MMSDMPERIWVDVGRDPTTRVEHRLWCDYFDLDATYRTEYIRADLAAEQVERLEAERRELEEGLSEMVSWARDIAGDCVDDKQREMEEDMMERMDALLARVRAQENSDE